MKKIFFGLFSLLSIICCSQEKSEQELLANTGLQKIKFELNNDVIEYLITDELPSQKGIIFYSQGSMPMPLMLKENDNIYTTFPFDYGSYYNEYRFVVISKPGIPIIPKKKNLDNRNLYINDKGEWSDKYLQTHFLSYYTNSLNSVINHVLNKSKKENKKIILIGHSQGARVVTKVANINNKVTHLVYLSGNPLGRIDESIRRKREAVICGQITEQQAHEEILAIYEKWNVINKNKNSLKVKEKEDSNYTWYSFSEYTVDDLLNLTIPIFVGYGTRDITARYCDLLPIDFIRHQKTNLTHKPYLGYDHSFNKIKADGKPDFNNSIIHNVMKDAINWVELN